MSVVLGIDYGTKNIGLALKKAGVDIIFPWGILKNDDNAVERILALCLHESVETVVVGLPLGLDGKDTRSTTAVRAFVEQLTPVVPCEVVMVDERFTTQEAARKDALGGASRDERSAQLVVETYVQRHAKK